MTFGETSIERVQVPNQNKKLCNYDSRTQRETLRGYFYCIVCGYRSHEGWASVGRCPSCSSLGGCHFHSYYNEKEIQYILNKGEGCKP